MICMAKLKHKDIQGWYCCSGSGKYFWGVLLLVLGGLFLARDLGYLQDVSAWTIFFIVFGALLLVKNLK